MDTKYLLKKGNNVSKISHHTSRIDPLILIVEDDQDNQLLLKYAIAMFGWKYMFAVNALDVISIAKEKQPDLVLLDIVMPEIDGFQIANLLKSQFYTKNIPLIAVTGLTGKEEKNLIFAAGFDGYLGKPFALDDLRQAIISTLNSANSAQYHTP